MYRRGTSIVPAEDVTFFSSVDRTGEPGFFLRFLDEANKLPDVIAFKPIIGRIVVPRHRQLSPGVAREIAETAGWNKD